ncbi:MAG: hypothetical protein WD009_02400 [Phycisphaeraceae bacterium]
MTEEEIQQAIAEYGKSYPPMLSVPQAAEIGDVSKATVYEWSSQKRLDDFATKHLGRLRLLRDRYVEWLLTGGRASHE